jgi:cathepsin B
LAIAFAVKVQQPTSVSFEDELIVTSKLVNEINNAGSTWVASTEQGSFINGITKSSVRALLGAKRGGLPLPKKVFAKSDIRDLPTNFDARTNWPYCATIKQVRDQSACGSCWAFGAAEAISDRYCIFLKVNLTLSTDDLLACCDSCGDGCDGGFPQSAWEYWVNSGLVTENCAPYPFPSCDHHVPNSKNPCPSNEYPTPPCVRTCKNGQTWSRDKHHGRNAYSLSGESDIMQELYKNGPVETAFDVYEDFLAYKSGVYQHKSGGYLGGHAVKILGYGVENGVKYWLVANSWNSSWGDDGFFKILRGHDECGIEDEISAGVPKD